MDVTKKGIYLGKQKQDVMDIFMSGESWGKRKRDLHRLLLGKIGKGFELKSLSIWAEKEFGIPLPVEYESDNNLIEACSLLLNEIKETDQITTMSTTQQPTYEIQKLPPLMTFERC